MGASATRDRLIQGLEELGVPASPDQLNALLALAERVEAWGRRMNLSGHRTADAIVGRLVLDAAALLAAAPGFGSLADLGSGAGFPGLPIAILRPEIRVTLVDSRERRHHFQRMVRRELALENVEPLLGRAEALEPRPHEAVLAQALAEPGQALALMRPWAGPGGWLLLPGAEEAPALPELPGVEAEGVRRYAVPGGGPRRTLWVGRAR